MCDNVTFEDLLFWETGWAVYRNSVSTRSRSRLEYIRINIIAGLNESPLIVRFLLLPRKSMSPSATKGNGGSGERKKVNLPAVVTCIVRLSEM